MNLPTDKECFRIIKEMEMMDHIIDHSVMVSNVAVCLCRGMRRTSPELNEDLIRTAALLHDITKTRSFSTGEIHSETGGGLMREMGYPEIGEIIRQHVILDHNSPDGPVSESEIVNYADKRVLHDQVVSLDQRLEYIVRKYGKKTQFRPLIQKMWDATTALEKKIFRKLPFPPEELPDQISPVVEKCSVSPET
ncbi:MAG: HD domain-containing protein [Desulfobacter sp.]|nr:MAG: HD domain-containing protein [Desulfobacter sp.]